jgi:hypothetical protein
MQAIEFEANLHNGFIQLPTNYQYWQQGKTVKVILLGNDDVEKLQQMKPSVSCLDLIRDDVGIIENAPHDLATNPAYMAGYGE